MPNLLVLANKRYHADFRKYMMRACERAGGRAMHIYCRDKLIISWAGNERDSFSPDVNETAILHALRACLGDEKLIVLTGLGSGESAAAVRLQRILANAVRVYDVYDDPTVNTTGFDFVDTLMQDIIWRCRCEHTIVRDAELRNRYPRAHHIDNASHLKPIAAVAHADPRSMVYIGSIDARVDFGWLHALTANDLQLAIWGRVHEAAPQTQAELDDLLQRRPNVSFHGRYDNDDLTSILGTFRVGVLPYKVGHPMTQHVNPDKLYHYLNAGLEVLAAPIPQARRHAGHLHLVTADGAWSEAIAAVTAAPRRGDWSAERNSWDKRWSELLACVDDMSAQLRATPADRTGAG